MKKLILFIGLLSVLLSGCAGVFDNLFGSNEPKCKTDCPDRDKKADGCCDDYK